MDKYKKRLHLDFQNAGNRINDDQFTLWTPEELKGKIEYNKRLMQHLNSLRALLYYSYPPASPECKDGCVNNPPHVQECESVLYTLIACISNFIKQSEERLRKPENHTWRDSR